MMAAAEEPEDVGSKLTAGFFQFASFTEAGRHSSSDVKHEPFTGVAQRERAGLIIPRTLVRTQPPVIVKLDVKRSNLHRGGAEEARGAHNSEVTGSSPVSGILSSWT